MYPLTLLIHSWLRYPVLIAGIWLLVASIGARRRGAPWSPQHERFQVAFVASLDLQLLLGLLMYFVLSPISAAALGDFGAAMKDPTLRFFGVEHIATMTLAVVAAHVGRARGKRQQEPRQRHRTTLIFQLIWLLLTLAAIPWPVLDIGRPLFRF